MLDTTFGILFLFTGVTLFSIGVLMLRATRRVAAYTAEQKYSQAVQPALRERGAYVAHGMVDGDNNLLIPQRKKADSYYESLL